MSSPRVICPECRFEGPAETPGMVKAPEESAFRYLGHDEEGNLLLMCPRCQAENSFHVQSALGNIMKTSTMLIGAALLAAVLALLRLLIFGW